MALRKKQSAVAGLIIVASVITLIWYQSYLNARNEPQGLDSFITVMESLGYEGIEIHDWEPGLAAQWKYGQELNKDLRYSADLETRLVLPRPEAGIPARRFSAISCNRC